MGGPFYLPLLWSRSPTWHVVIGTNFGSHVVHATKNFIYFYLGPKAILLFKSG